MDYLGQKRWKSVDVFEKEGTKMVLQQKVKMKLNGGDGVKNVHRKVKLEKLI